MASRYEEINFKKVNLLPIADRCSLVSADKFSEPVRLTKAQADLLLKSFPDILAGTELRSLIHSLLNARETGSPRIWAMGAHAIKVGLSRHLIALMEAGFISHLAVNGAFTVHDTEISCFGHTSEDVASSIVCGEFAVTKETGDLINLVIKNAKDNGMGFGEALGKTMFESNPRFVDLCVSASAYRFNIPFTVHVAVGTDVTHIHPEADGAAIGETSFRDFRIFVSSVSRLKGGIIINLGSAVVLPVVIEKAIAVARNLGYGLDPFDGFNLDFIRHYRPGLNPVKRAIESGGHGGHITGHHELVLPLICAVLLAV